MNKIIIQEKNNNKKISVKELELTDIVKEYEIVRTENVRKNNLILTIPLDNVQIDINKDGIT